jgi:hypothetical protein
LDAEAKDLGSEIRDLFLLEKSVTPVDFIRLLSNKFIYIRGRDRFAF